MEETKIIDDGTLDTVVLFMGIEHRYDSEFRFSFDSDDEFLEFAELQLSAEYLEQRQLHHNKNETWIKNGYAPNEEVS